MRRANPSNSLLRFAPEHIGTSFCGSPSCCRVFIRSELDDRVRDVRISSIGKSIRTLARASSSLHLRIARQDISHYPGVMRFRRIAATRESGAQPPNMPLQPTPTTPAVSRFAVTPAAGLRSAGSTSASAAVAPALAQVASATAWLSSHR